MLALFHKMSLSGTLSVGSRVRLYRTLAAIFTSENDPILGSYMCRLPFSLVLKTSHSSTMNEAVALRYLSQVPGINAPFCIDCVRTDVGCYLLSTWISGDCFHDVWDALTSQDKEQLCQQLFEQFQALRKDHSVKRTVSNALGLPMEDPRIPWDDPQFFYFSSDFFRAVWRGFDWPRSKDTIASMIQLMIYPAGVFNVFCLGDLEPKNIILEGELEKWRREKPSCISLTGNLQDGPHFLGMR